MHPGACGRIWIVHDQGEALRLSRRLGPTERRRGVWAVAGEFLWNGFSGRKSSTRDFHGSSLGLREGSCTKERGKAQRRTDQSSEQISHNAAPVIFTQAGLGRAKNQDTFQQSRRGPFSGGCDPYAPLHLSMHPARRASA